VIRQTLAEPDPLRLAWRELIKNTIQEVVLQPERDPLTIIQQCVAAQVRQGEREGLEAVIVEELQRLHEGVLARYRLRPSELEAWRRRGSPRGSGAR
jgi:hypothetical protein